MDEYFLKVSVPLIVGYLLDLLLGDPRWLPHPIRLFGNVISFGDKWLNNGKARMLKGVALTMVFCFFVFLFFYFTIYYLYQLNSFAYYSFASIFVFYGLANKSLLDEGKEVFTALHQKGLEAGRKRLSWIVGRDTSNLTENQIRTAVFETLSENLSDGVIAPIFYYAIFGVPGMMTYKMINTLDSMIGYKSEKYFYFGKFAARLDDIVNYIPARITAFLIALVSLEKRSLKFIFKYGSKHSSPNSGYPEAALAGALNCRFGGPNVYHGKIVEKPFIGKFKRELKHEEFGRVQMINHSVTFLMICIIVGIYFFV